MAAAVSPLAPKSVPDAAADRRREARDRRGRHQISRPHRRAAGAARARHHRGRRVHQIEMPVGAGRMVPRQSQGRQSRARWWSIPATPMPSPARPAGRPASSPPRSRPAPSAAEPADVFLASTGVIGEPLNAKAFDGVMEGMVVAAHDGAVARRRQGDHDHRHLPQGRDRARPSIGKATVTINGIAKGAGMIAPDMATMLSFVFTDAPIGARALQALLERRRRRHLQRRDHRRRHLDLRYAAGVRDRRRRCGAPRISTRRRSAAQALPQGVRQRAGQSRRAGGARRRRRAQAGRDQGRGRGVEGLGAQDRACRSPTRRW